MKKCNRIDSKNTDKYREIFGVRLFGSNEMSLLNLIEESWGKQVQWVATVNPEFVMNALKDREFLNILQKRTTVNVIDGIGLVWADKVKSGGNFLKVGVEILMGKHRESLITGADLMDRMCMIAAQKGRSVYFFGGWNDRSQKTAEYFLTKYPSLKVVGAGAEDFDFKVKTDYLFVARGMKKQEEWIDASFEKLQTNLVMGVGRSFDYYSGELNRAPNWVRRIGMEWLYSLLMEPKRWRRQLELPKFIWKVLFSKERF